MDTENEVAVSEEVICGYVKSLLRLANFIDNFADFMYYNTQEAIQNVPEGLEESEFISFLTGLRKEIADFHIKVKSLMEGFQI